MGTIHAHGLLDLEIWHGLSAVFDFPLGGEPFGDDQRELAVRALELAVAKPSPSVLASLQNLELVRIQGLALGRGEGEQEARFPQELQALEQTVATGPLDGQALLGLGRLAERAGELERAVLY